MKMTPWAFYPGVHLKVSLGHPSFGKSMSPALMKGQGPPLLQHPWAPGHSECPTLEQEYH